jgi:hypothetical protein
MKWLERGKCVHACVEGCCTSISISPSLREPRCGTSEVKHLAMSVSIRLLVQHVASAMATGERLMKSILAGVLATCGSAHERRRTGEQRATIEEREALGLDLITSTRDRLRIKER